VQAEVLDELLWEFDPDAYIPHQIAGMDEGRRHHAGADRAAGNAVADASHW
jgi:DNA polymerase IIIc chi subunit